MKTDGWTSAPTRTPLLAAITLPLWTAHEQWEQGVFSWWESDGHVCAAQCSPRESTIESATMSPPNENRTTRPASKRSRDIRGKLITPTSYCPYQEVSNDDDYSSKGN